MSWIAHLYVWIAFLLLYYIWQAIVKLNNNVVKAWSIYISAVKETHAAKSAKEPKG
jgi:hypothetical protein